MSDFRDPRLKWFEYQWCIHTPLVTLWCLDGPHFDHQQVSSAPKAQTRTLNSKNHFFSQGTTTPQLSSGPRRVQIPGDRPVQWQKVSLLARTPGMGCWGFTENMLSLRTRSACSPGAGGAARHAQQQSCAGLREAPPVNVSGFLKVK